MSDLLPTPTLANVIMPLPYGSANYQLLSKHERRCAVSEGAITHRDPESSSRYVLEFTSKDSKTAYEKCRSDTGRFEAMDTERCDKILAIPSLFVPPLREYQECLDRRFPKFIPGTRDIVSVPFRKHSEW
jgi:hypothetical protein